MSADNLVNEFIDDLGKDGEVLLKITGINGEAEVRKLIALGSKNDKPMHVLYPIGIKIYKDIEGNIIISFTKGGIKTMFG